MTTEKKERPAVGTALIRELAVAASVDPTTIRKVLAGAPPHGLARERAAKVLRERGLLPPLPEE